MKKEYIILIVLIIGLSAYLVTKKDDRVLYELPVLDTLNAGTIDRIEITKGDRHVALAKADKKWTLSGEKFPADPSGVEKILDVIEALGVSTLVSEAQDRVRYELDPSNALSVKAFQGQTLKRAFSIGKTAPSFNHTFIMLDDDPRIYQADKNFRNDFDKSVDELRHKLVLEFASKEIQKITLEKSGKALTLTAVTPEKKEGDKKAEGPTWQAQNGAPADRAALDDLISSLSHLECQSFLDSKGTKGLEKEIPVCKITLENNTVLGLNLFQQDGQETMAGTSTWTPYAFSLAAYKAKDIVSYVDKLLGIEQKKDTPET